MQCWIARCADQQQTATEGTHTVGWRKPVLVFSETRSLPTSIVYKQGWPGCASVAVVRAADCPVRHRPVSKNDVPFREQLHPIVSMTGSRQAQLLEATNLLLNARRTSQPMAELPPDLRPETPEEAFYIQSQLIDSFGEVGGWKVGAGSPEAEPICAPMPRPWIAGNGASLAAPHFRLRGLEAEVAFLLGKDLPPREVPYTRAEIQEAILSCHPAFEILESALLDPTSPEVHRLSQIADLQMNGGFVYGPACPQWKEIDFGKETVTLSVDGVIRVERTGSNTAGDLMRLLPWLANEGSARTGGLSAGQWVTTGSWTGVTLATSGSGADAMFSTLGRVSLSFL